MASRLNRRGRQSSNPIAAMEMRDLERHMLRLMRVDRSEGGLGDEESRDKQRSRFLQAQDATKPVSKRRPGPRSY